MWEAVHEFIQRGNIVARDEVLRRFRHDDEASVRGVLRDLTESGLVFAAGTGRSQAYRSATSDEIRTLRHGDDRLGLEAFAWSVIYRDQPIAIGRLSELTHVPVTLLEPALESLVASGRVEQKDDGHYVTRELVLGFEAAAGWEASVLDHFSTLVRTITTKLGLDQKASLADEVGGSTYHFSLWRGHPLEQDVLGELRRFRERMSALRDRIDRYNADHPDRQRPLRVDAYYGQTLTEEDDDNEVESQDDQT